MPTRPLPTLATRLVVLATLASALVLAGAGVAFARTAVPAAPQVATTAECTGVVSDLRNAVSADDEGENAQPGSVAANDRAARIRDLFATAASQHPSCEADIQRFGLELASRSQPTIKGTAFWGPIGWLWNNVYYRVFNGNDIMMVLFGWALLLSPIILVFSSIWVLRGSKGAFRRPIVPEHLRTDG